MRKLKITEMGRMSVDEFKQSDKMPLVVVLDDVRSMYNVGSVFRTSDAYRVEGVFLCGITAQPPHPEIHKTALGIEQVEGSTMLQNLTLPADGHFAIVMGNEVKGVQQEVVDMCDGCLELPQFGTKHSLNVSTTAGIVIWEFAKQLMI